MSCLFSIKALPTRDTDIENDHLTDALMLEQLHSNHLLGRSYTNEENSDEDENINDKREVKRKWYNLASSAHGPYTIAFPALIRSRRWIQ